MKKSTMWRIQPLHRTQPADSGAAHVLDQPGPGHNQEERTWPGPKIHSCPAPTTATVIRSIAANMPIRQKWVLGQFRCMSGGEDIREEPGKEPGPGANIAPETLCPGVCL